MFQTSSLVLFMCFLFLYFAIVFLSLFLWFSRFSVLRFFAPNMDYCKCTYVRRNGNAIAHRAPPTRLVDADARLMGHWRQGRQPMHRRSRGQRHRWTLRVDSFFFCQTAPAPVVDDINIADQWPPARLSSCRACRFVTDSSVGRRQILRLPQALCPWHSSPCRCPSPPRP